MPDEPKPNVDRDDADLPEASAVEKADVDLGQKMASHRDDPLVKAAGYAGKLGDQAPLYALSAGLLIVGLASRDRRLTGSGISMMAALGVADLSKRLTKRLVSRTRPTCYSMTAATKATPAVPTRNRSNPFHPGTWPAASPSPAHSRATTRKPAPPRESLSSRSARAGWQKVRTGRST